MQRKLEMRRALRLPFLLLMVASVLLVGIPYACAQHSSAPAGPSDKEKAKARDKLIERKETDEAYKSTIKRIPDAKESFDPWGNLRATPAK